MFFHGIVARFQSGGDLCVKRSDRQSAFAGMLTTDPAPLGSALARTPLCQRQVPPLVEEQRRLAEAILAGGVRRSTSAAFPQRFRRANQDRGWGRGSHHPGHDAGA